MTSILMWCSSHLKARQFPTTHNQKIISTSTFLFQNLSSHYVVGYQVVQTFPCKEYNKNIQVMATSPYYNPTPTTYTSCESLRNI